MPIFELHITVDINNTARLETFIKHCSEHRLKPILVGVIYSKGFERFVQTSRYVTGTYDGAYQKLMLDADTLSSSGFQIKRRKIEAVVSTLDNLQDYVKPVNVEKALSQGYYETHIVLSLTEPYLTQTVNSFTDESQLINTSELQKIGDYNTRWYHGKPYWVPLSFNLKKADLSQCFITLRHYSDSFERRDSDEQQVINDITTGIPTVKFLKVIREFVCFDDNPSVDAEFKFQATIQPSI